MKGLTPMMQQYFAIKEQHKDHILFYRLGDFYEMFYDDALVASKELELTLTGRGSGLEERAPMCGIPYHSAEGYIARLIKKGYKVAICEQTEKAEDAKGLVNREVVRVITPGTLMENNMLDEATNNYLCCIYAGKLGYGLAFADISTGEVNVIETENNQAEVINELTRYMPKEVIFNPLFLDSKVITKFIKEKLLCTADLLEEESFDYNKAEDLVKLQFNVSEISDLGLSKDELYINALGGLINYLNETQKTGIERLISINLLNKNKFMNLNHSARTHLELTQAMRTGEKRGSLLWIIDKTKTAMGKRLVKTYINQPLINQIEIEKRLNAVEELYNNELLISNLDYILGKIHDLERLMTRVVYGNANPREYVSLKSTVMEFPELKVLIKSAKSDNLVGIYKDIDELSDLAEFLQRAVKEDPPATMREGGVINDGFDDQLDMLRDIIANSRKHLTALEAKEKESTGIKNLKIGYNKIFGYYFDVTKSYQNLVPQYYIRKQTLANSERYIIEDLKILEDKIIGAHDKIIDLEAQLFEDIRHFVIDQLHRVQRSAIAIANLDVFLSFAKTALEEGFVRPITEMSDRIDIKEGRHPVVESMLKNIPFVPNDTILNTSEDQIAIITGPNMAGKSTYMRQIAIIVLLAQIGCFVPAKSAIIGIVDGIYTRIGASDDLTAGESTFMVEMRELSEILASASGQSLIILDEIGRGTSTYDGMSIARAVIEYLAHNKSIKAKTLFATHYHELTAMEGVVCSVKNYHIAAKKRENDIIFLRRIVRGGTDDSYGIEVAQLAGVPPAVVNRAKKILAKLESDGPIDTVSKTTNSESQVKLESVSNMNNEVVKTLKDMDVETLTPLEALNKLYELKKSVEI